MANLQNESSKKRVGMGDRREEDRQGLRPIKQYRIGEVARFTGLSRQTIHNYTIMGLIKESEWSEGGHRLYDESVFCRLSHILKLKKTKTLSEIRNILLSQD